MEKRDRIFARIGIKWHSSSDYKDEKVWITKELDSWDQIHVEISAAQDCILRLA